MADELPEAGVGGDVSWDLAVDHYISTLEALKQAGRDLTATQVLEVLVARDALQEVRREERALSASDLSRLFELDECLKQSANMMAETAPLAEWRETRQPPESAWWWVEVTEDRRRLGWLWHSATAGILAVAASFMVRIFQAFSAGGISWQGTLTTIFHGVGLAYIGQGALTDKGRQRLQMLYRQWRIPATHSGAVTCGLALVLLVLSYALHLYLPRHFYDRGQELYAQGLLKHAERNFLRGLEITPRDSRFNLALGAVYESLGDLDQALSQYQQGVERSSALAFNNAGRVYIYRFDPRTRTRRLDLAETYLRMGVQRVDSSRDSGVQVAHVKYQLHRNLGWALLEQNRYDEAAVELELAIKLNRSIPDEPIGGGMAYCFLAHVITLQADISRAQDLWTLCRQQARPETLYEYKWVIDAGYPQLANCIDTSSIVSGLDQLPPDFQQSCGKQSQLVSTSD